ncbi:hypothetical protein EB001_04155 [bacterium]|nr:hypothetical protein [bacterium]
MAVGNEKIYRSFTKGLITEASPLTFPENASLDEQNFVLNRNGSRSRRLGLDYEGGYSLTSTGFSSAAIQTGKQSFHKWDMPGGDNTVAIGIIRILNKLWFIDLLTNAPSSNLLNGGSAITLSGLGDAEIETATINNKLIIVSEDLTYPVLLSYNSTTDTVSQTTITVEVRDIWGIDDGLLVNHRPTTLSNEHKYNLRNQGWSPTIQTTTGADAINRTFTQLGQYPANSDTWVTGKITNPSSADFEKFDADTMEKNSTSNYQVAKGSYIIDAFNRGSERESNSGITGLPVDQETGAFSTVASYAGRIFYSGVNSAISGGDAKSPNFSGYVFFTTVVTGDDKLGVCYQEADPTDANINDLVTTDGGTIQIPEATQIVKIVSSQASLLVFADNGVWEVYGDTGGFIATSFQTSKVSTNGVKNAKSIVNVNGNFVYWSKAGIYLLSPDPGSGRFSAKSLSLTTIQSLFLDIPTVGKNYCKGFYDEKENRVRWLYNDSDTYTTSNYINKYTKELVLDLTLEAFYLNSFSSLASNSPYIADYIEIPGYAVASEDANVLVGTDEVIVTSADKVIITQDVVASRSTQFSYLTMIGTSFTISKFTNRKFTDWETAGSGTGADYSSYLVTGYELFGDIIRNKQIPYIFFYFNRTEDGFTTVGSTLQIDNPSSCLVQAQWNWADSANSGKWGNQFQAYRLLRNYIPSGPADTFDYGDSVIVTKNKLRGSGKTISLKIQSEAGKDMQILGWGVSAVATSKP